MKIRKNSWFYKNVDEIIEDFSSFGNPSILLIIWLMIFGLSLNYLLMFILGMFFVEIIGGTIKVIWYKDRPEKMAHQTLLDKVYAGSFPSIHVARATFVISIISTRYQGILLVMFPLIIASVVFSRLYLKKHYISDVFGGFFLGLVAVLIAILVF